MGGDGCLTRLRPAEPELQLGHQQFLFPRRK